METIKKFLSSFDNKVAMAICFVLTFGTGLILKPVANTVSVFFGAFFAGVFGLIVYSTICQYKKSDNDGDPTAAGIGVAVGLILLALTLLI